MYKHILHLLSRKNFTIAASAAACIAGSFLIGIRSAGDGQPLVAPPLQASAFVAYDVPSPASRAPLPALRILSESFTLDVVLRVLLRIAP